MKKLYSMFLAIIIGLTSMQTVQAQHSDVKNLTIFNNTNESITIHIRSGHKQKKGWGHKKSELPQDRAQEVRKLMDSKELNRFIRISQLKDGKIVIEKTDKNNVMALPKPINQTVATEGEDDQEDQN